LERKLHILGTVNNPAFKIVQSLRPKGDLVPARVSLLVWLAVNILGASLALGASTVTGSVKNAGGKTMNGVFVSATADGSDFTVTVYSDDAGRFRFTELAEGTYTVVAHTGGFQPSQRSNVAVKDGKAVPLDFTLEVETRPAELVKQSTAAEWLASLPGTMQQKYSLSRNCDGCHHNVYQLRDYRFTKEDWMKIISVMERIDAIGEVHPASVPRWLVGNKEDIAAYLAEVQGPDSPLIASPGKTRCLTMSIWMPRESRGTTISEPTILESSTPKPVNSKSISCPRSRGRTLVRKKCS
jgi:Carboxypeptidase regulatory-like domain